MRGQGEGGSNFLYIASVLTPVLHLRCLSEFEVILGSDSHTFFLYPKNWLQNWKETKGGWKEVSEETQGASRQTGFSVLILSLL